MSEEALKSLSDMASEAHARIQQAHEDINPVIGVRQGMRDVGIPADAMTVDCLTTRRRILIVLHDENPEYLMYQFTTIDEEMTNNFQQMARKNVTSDVLFEWIENYFSRGAH